MEVNGIRLDQMTNACLASAYEEICEEYCRRLNKQWNLDINHSWRLPQRTKGEFLTLNDLGFSAVMCDVRLFVEEGISYEEFIKWWDYNAKAIKNGCDEINAYTWFMGGYRGEKGGVG